MGLVKQDESNTNIMRGNLSDYLELVSDLGKIISSKKLRNTAVCRSCVKITKITRNENIDQMNKKLKFSFDKYHSSTKVT